MYILIIYAVISLISLLIIWSFMKDAPLGWEDEKGFHYGTPGNITTCSSKEEAEKKVIEKIERENLLTLNMERSNAKTN